MVDELGGEQAREQGAHEPDVVAEHPRPPRAEQADAEAGDERAHERADPRQRDEVLSQAIQRVLEQPSLAAFRERQRVLSRTAEATQNKDIVKTILHELNLEDG